jgi:3-methyladenine DNA glycosylase AlkC
MSYKMKLPDAPRSIQKGVPLKELLNINSLDILSSNIFQVYPKFDSKEFVLACLMGLDKLGIMDRGKKIANHLFEFLPKPYESGLDILVRTFTEKLTSTSDLGLSGMFYLPHSFYISQFGLDPQFNQGRDPFEASMNAQYELTQRFTSEFAIRPFIIQEPERTLTFLNKWLSDTSPHVRRLCSEGSRSRLPWATRITQFAQDPSPVIEILESLKNDPDLYVRRSVANHIGDIAKDHLELALNLCEEWLVDANNELRWVIRHALRNPVKKEVPRAMDIRLRAKALKP